MFRKFRMPLALLASTVAIVAVPASASADTTASPTDLNFGTLPVGQQSVSQVVTLTQSCTPTDVNCLTGIAQEVFNPVINATSGFTQTNGCPVDLLTTLLGGSSTCQVVVKFVPNTIGQITGLLNTGPGGPVVNLSGAGAAPASAATQKHAKKCKKHKHRSLASAAKKKCKKHH